MIIKNITDISWTYRYPADTPASNLNQRLSRPLFVVLSQVHRAHEKLQKDPRFATINKENRSRRLYNSMPVLLA